MLCIAGFWTATLDASYMYFKSCPAVTTEVSLHIVNCLLWRQNQPPTSWVENYCCFICFFLFTYLFFSLFILPPTYCIVKLIFFFLPIWCVWSRISFLFPLFLLSWEYFCTFCPSGFPLLWITCSYHFPNLFYSYWI